MKIFLLTSLPSFTSVQIFFIFICVHSRPFAVQEKWVACHLLKAVDYWTDVGFGDFGLYYVRDKAKRECDFLVVREGQPWFLVEVKAAQTRLSSSVGYFQGQTGARHAFQVVFALPYEEVDCFDYAHPVVVSARTFLAQLI